ncbi:hypothetical protein AVEN_112812-1, partial [Araneus ventricosus]
VRAGAVPAGQPARPGDAHPEGVPGLGAQEALPANEEEPDYARHQLPGMEGKDTPPTTPPSSLD